MTSTARKKIYKTALEVLSARDMTHSELVERTVAMLYGGSNTTDAPVGEFTEIRGLVGTVIREMRNDGVISCRGDMCTLVTKVPIAMKLYNCEKEILSLLSSEPKTKIEIRSYLQRIYGTDKTPSKSDDKMLFDHIGQLLRRLTAEGKAEIKEGRYRLCDETRAKIDDIGEMLDLKHAFISKIHRNGGEFFEHYIMTLLSRHAVKCGKRVTDARVTAGSADGGIDGILKTVDQLGFKETTMVQAKNRTDMTSETMVRGFYGAVCAVGGSRGIYACMSDFHPSAKIFLSGIDNCVGLSGDDIFRLACECQYGVKKKDGKYVIDNKIL